MRATFFRISIDELQSKDTGWSDRTTPPSATVALRLNMFTPKRHSAAPVLNFQLLREYQSIMKLRSNPMRKQLAKRDGVAKQASTHPSYAV